MRPRGCVRRRHLATMCVLLAAMPTGATGANGWAWESTRSGPPPAAHQAPLLSVDHERSTVVAKLKRAGLLRFLGHEHGIVPQNWSASVRFDPADLDASSIVVEIDAAGLVIDSEAARSLAGVDPDGPDEQETRQISADMHSPEYLDSARFPTLRFESSALRMGAPPAEGSSTELRIDGALTLHGVSREISIDSRIEREGGSWVVRGGFEIAQRDFGIEPASIGGVVKVADEVEIRFEVFAEPAGRGSPPPKWRRRPSPNQLRNTAAAASTSSREPTSVR